MVRAVPYFLWREWHLDYVALSTRRRLIRVGPFRILIEWSRR